MCPRTLGGRTPSSEAALNTLANTLAKAGQVGKDEGDRKRPDSAFVKPPIAQQPSSAAPSPASPSLARRPATPPPFKLSDLRSAIPARCFQKSALRSLAYVAVDLALLAAAATAAAHINTLTTPGGPAWAAAWVAYWCVAGVVGTGVWVCAHECGHGAFSNSPLLNDAVGAILHSCLLVPYWSWKYSHARHHAHTGDVEGDEVFVPPVSAKPGVGGRAEIAGTPTGRALRSAPGRLAAIAAALTLGWPLYLGFNVSGRDNYYKDDKKTDGDGGSAPSSKPFRLPPNHFDPASPIFSKRQRAGVAASTALCAAVLAGLAAAVQAHGVRTVIAFYGIPLLIVNAWLVIITLLQHSHPALPHYASSKDWDWLRGALATVDRSYGRVLDTAFHHIADTHVLHHLFSGIPHYHAQEASAAIRPVLGEWYARDEARVGLTGVVQALWEDWRDCHWVSPDKDGESALWFRGDRD